MSDRHRRRTRVVGVCAEEDNREARVVGVCKSLCNQTNPAFLYPVPWLQGSTGATGPPGNIAFSRRGRLNGASYMLDKYDERFTTYQNTFADTPVVLTSLSSPSPYFLERFQSSVSTEISATEFTQTTKMIYGLREVVATFSDTTYMTHSNINVNISGKPIYYYALGPDGEQIYGINSLANGEGLWNTQVLGSISNAALKAPLIITGDGFPVFAILFNGNYQVQFYAPQSKNAISEWIVTPVHILEPTEFTSGIALMRAANGLAAIASTIDSLTDHNMHYYTANNSQGTGSWNDNIVFTDTVLNYPINLLLHPTNLPAIVYYHNGELRYVSSNAVEGTTGSWIYDSVISSNPNLSYASVTAIMLPTGFPAVFYKIVGEAGIQLAISTSPTGDSTWNYYTIIPELAWFACAMPTLFALILPNRTIGLMYGDAIGLSFGYARITNPSAWTTNIVDHTIPSIVCFPSAVVTEDGYIQYIYSCYGESAVTVVHGRSAILNEMRMLDTNSYVINWAASTSTS